MARRPAPEVIELAKAVSLLASLVDALVNAGPPPLDVQRATASDLAQHARARAREVAGIPAEPPRKLW
jgi:hypothetical protein